MFTKRSDPDEFCFILWDLPWVGRPRGRWDGGSCRTTLGFVLEEGAAESPHSALPSKERRVKREG